MSKRRTVRDRLARPFEGNSDTKPYVRVVIVEEQPGVLGMRFKHHPKFTSAEALKILQDAVDDIGGNLICRFHSEGLKAA